MQTWKYKYVRPSIDKYACVWSGGADKGHLPHATDDKKEAFCVDQEDAFDVEAEIARRCLIRHYLNTLPLCREEIWDFIHAIGNPRLKAFVFCGHGEVKCEDPIRYKNCIGTGLLLFRSEEGSIPYSYIKNECNIAPLTFVFLSACCGAHGLSSFPLSSKGASVGFPKVVGGWYATDYLWHLLTRLSVAMPLADAKSKIEEHHPKLIDRLEPVYNGNMNMRLGDDTEEEE